MGTRNLTMVFYKGEYVVAKYCQWDGYPSGQGITALEFVRDKMRLRKFTNNIKALTEATKDYIEALYKAAGHDGASTWVSMEVSEKIKKVAPQLHRDMGADILEFIQTQKPGLPIKNDLNFAADGLFCEWAYVVDLDKKTLEVYKGFVEGVLPVTERFAFLQSKVRNDSSSNYAPVSHVRTWTFAELPTNEEFVAELEKE